ATSGTRRTTSPPPTPATPRSCFPTRSPVHPVPRFPPPSRPLGATAEGAAPTSRCEKLLGSLTGTCHDLRGRYRSVFAGQLTCKGPASPRGRGETGRIEVTPNGAARNTGVARR